MSVDFPYLVTSAGTTLYFHNISGDMPRMKWEYQTFQIPGVNGTGTQVDGQVYPDQSFRFTQFLPTEAEVITLKNQMETLPMSVCQICNSLGELWNYCLILDVNFPPDATKGVIAFDVPSYGDSVNPQNVFNRKVDFDVLVRFLFNTNNQS